MSDGVDEARRAWIKRVLGIELQPAGVSGHAGVSARKAMPIWRDARDITGEQLNKLQDAMRNSGLSLFKRIADMGLNGITETRLVGMQVALMNLDSTVGADRPKSIEKARKAVAEMRNFLNSNPVLPLLEANPLNVPVSIRASLGQALEQIEQILVA